MKLTREPLCCPLTKPLYTNINNINVALCRSEWPGRSDDPTWDHIELLLPSPFLNPVFLIFIFSHYTVKALFWRNHDASSYSRLCYETLWLLKMIYSWTTQRGFTNNLFFYQHFVMKQFKYHWLGDDTICIPVRRGECFDENAGK